MADSTNNPEEPSTTPTEDSPTIQAIKEAFSESGIEHYSVDADRSPPDTIFKFSVGLESDRVSCVVVDKKSSEHLLILLSSTARVPQEMRQLAAVYFSHVNFGMGLGNFELDMSDGEVRFNNSATYRGFTPSKECIKESFAIGCGMMDRFLPGLLATIHGGKDPEAAYRDCCELGDSNDSTAEAQ